MHLRLLMQRAIQQIHRSPLVHPHTREEHNARLLLLNTSMIGISSGGIVAFMPVFLARLGASPTLLGWLNSAPALLAVFLRIPGAMIAERYANQVRVRSTVASFVYSAYLLCGLMPFFLPAQQLPTVLVAIWTLQAVGESITVPSWMAVLHQAVLPQHRAQLNGIRWAMLSLLSAASSAFFGWLLDHIAFPLNYQIVFFISFATALLDPFFFSFIKVPPLEKPVVNAVRGLGKRVAEYLNPVFHYKPFMVYLAATMLYRLALNLPSPLFSLFWVNELHASDTLIGLRGTIGHAALVVGYIFWGRSANRLGHRKVLTLSALTLALYPLVTALSSSAFWLLPAAAIWGLTASGVDIGLFDLMLASCPERRQPLFAAFWSIAANMAIFIGPLLGAMLSEATSLSAALIIAAVAQALTTIPFVLLPGDV
jgi:MFS family permease